MQVSQKALYALRAVFELAKRYDQGPVKISDIAEAQAIPQRFLEVILSQLKQAGFLESRRGSDGGYVLSRSPEELTVADVVGFIQGPVGPTACLIEKSSINKCSLYDTCIFKKMWGKIRDAISKVYDNTTFSDLVKEEGDQSQPCVIRK
ncbi:RrF2 family transcriptional regulator [Planctomycetota bacterium]